MLRVTDEKMGVCVCVPDEAGGRCRSPLGLLSEKLPPEAPQAEQTLKCGVQVARLPQVGQPGMEKHTGLGPRGVHIFTQVNFNCDHPNLSIPQTLQLIFSELGRGVDGVFGCVSLDPRNLNAGTEWLRPQRSLMAPGHS